jgi:hypothetical protein
MSGSGVGEASVPILYGNHFFRVFSNFGEDRVVTDKEDNPKLFSLAVKNLCSRRTQLKAPNDRDFARASQLPATDLSVAWRKKTQS